MKIVVITGSPRKNGNSFAMTDAFIKKIENLRQKRQVRSKIPTGRKQTSNRLEACS